jgi:hypothetical protein
LGGPESAAQSIAIQLDEIIQWRNAPSFAAHISEVHELQRQRALTHVATGEYIEAHVAPAALLQRFFLHIVTMVSRCHIVTARRTGFVIRCVGL